MFTIVYATIVILSIGLIAEKFVFSPKKPVLLGSPLVASLLIASGIYLAITGDTNYRVLGSALAIMWTVFLVLMFVLLEPETRGIGFSWVKRIAIQSHQYTKHKQKGYPATDSVKPTDMAELTLHDTDGDGFPDYATNGEETFRIRK